MAYVKLQSENFPGTVTNERSDVAKGLSNDLINPYERREISRLGLVAKLGTDTKKNMSAMFPLSCEEERPRISEMAD